MAVVNDTTGTLMSCAHKNRECRVGVIVGTGTNACYMETLENVPLFDAKKELPDPGKRSPCIGPYIGQNLLTILNLNLYRLFSLI